MIGFTAPHRFTQLGTTGNTALSLFYILSSSLLHIHYGSWSSLVISWQWIYHILTVTSKSHMKSSLHSLVHFLPLFSSCQFRRLNSIPLLPSSYPGRLASWNSTLHFRLLLYTRLLLLLGCVFWLCPFITPRHGPHRKHSLYCLGGVFTCQLPSNGYTHHNI
jgi:hypothetical protein